MKEYPFTYDEALTKGLRRFSTVPVNEQELVECHNLAPSDLGLEPHEALTSLNASNVAWGGLGAKAGTTDTRDITISIKDYVDDDDISGASVYVDDVLMGTTDANGELDISGITVGGHSLRVTAAGYVDSEDDDLLNDYFVVA